ncbi:DegT/DnrJ/EryC1/StrS family aminotransferase [Planktomarina temperata]|nr:DegT/DnrJ/EryC1/StrS family aminotransferase [Planktomarina temperata]
MVYKLASDSWDERELNAIKSVIATGQYTLGNYVSKFEDEFSEFLGVKHSIMVNSGSSANLIMLHALSLTTEKNKNEIIVPAVSWSTTYFPVHQAGFKLKFVDINPATLNMDIRGLAQNINENTAAVLWVSLLGNCADLEEARKLCDQHDVKLLEDNCESFGASSTLGLAGSIGSMGTHSFFFSHHLQTMEGGMLSTNCDTLAANARSLRAHGWTRDTKSGDLSNLADTDFQKSYEFILPGFCVRPVEFMGAIGSVQLEKWPEMLQHRQNNAAYFQQHAARFEHQFRIQETKGTVSSWFGFSVILNDQHDRDQITTILKENNIEVRPIVAGNFTKQPVISKLNHINGDSTFPNSDRLHYQGFFIGNDSRCIKTEIDYFFKIIGAYFND